MYLMFHPNTFIVYFCMPLLLFFMYCWSCLTFWCPLEERLEGGGSVMILPSSLRFFLVLWQDHGRPMFYVQVHGLLFGPCACVVSSRNPCYPCLVMIAWSVSRVPLVSFLLFNPLVFAVLCRFIVIPAVMLYSVSPVCICYSYVRVIAKYYLWVSCLSYVPCEDHVRVFAVSD